MTPAREHAMAALRAWAAPGARAHLIAAAWRAGEHSIVALADAAAVSRPTVYADLASVGIDPRTDRTEPPVIGTITLGPFTGSGTKQQLDAIFTDHRKSWPNDGTAEEKEDHVLHGIDLIDQEFAVRYHNHLVPTSQEEAVHREVAQQALHRMEISWAALSTARAWQAAHHEYVVAVDAARTAIAAWQTAADATNEIRSTVWKRSEPGAHPKAYLKWVPEEQRITVDPRVPAAAAAALEETYAHRRTLVRETLGVPADTA